MVSAYLLDENESDLRQLALDLARTGAIHVAGMSTAAAEAIARMRELCPDVLFLELRLSSMHGIHVMKTVRQYQPHIQIVIVSQESQFALLAFEHGVTDYLLKPWTIDRLRRTVERLNRG